MVIKIQVQEVLTSSTVPILTHNLNMVISFSPVPTLKGTIPITIWLALMLETLNWTDLKLKMRILKKSLNLKIS